MLKTDICVIGAGSGGLSVAVGAAKFGAHVILVESGKMGGDCLNYGCVPSKSIISAARHAFDATHGKDFGIEGSVKVNSKGVYDHIHDVIAAIEPNDSVERMENLGIKVIKNTAFFTGPRELQVGKESIRAKWFVIATGSSPVTPHIAGLEHVPFYTNETIFDVKGTIDHLIIIGGGPIGLEMAQTFRRLGSKVSVIQRTSILPRDDEEAAEVIREVLIREGVELIEHAQVQSVEKVSGDISLTYTQNGVTKKVVGSNLLIAVGRHVNVDALKLEAAKVEYDSRKIKVDKRLRTNNKNIFAIGDVIGQHQFTHIANYHAGIVLRNMLFRCPAKVDTKTIPWVTYTDPELAQVGMQEKQAKYKHPNYRVLRWSFDEIDRAHCERKIDGHIKVLTTKKGVVIGATIVGPHAGELLMPWILAIQNGLNIKDIARLIIPYPTFSEINKKVASTYFTPMLFSKKVKYLVRFLLSFKG